MIKYFLGNYEFLNNKYPCTVIIKNRVYGSAQEAYLEEGGSEDPKNRGIMRDVLAAKFTQNLELKRLLSETSDEIVYVNIQHPCCKEKDMYWGVVNGEGENVLGQLLMEIRAMIKNGMYAENHVHFLDDSKKHLKRFCFFTACVDSSGEPVESTSQEHCILFNTLVISLEEVKRLVDSGRYRSDERIILTTPAAADAFCRGIVPDMGGKK